MAGACELRAGARDRVAGGRSGGRVPCAARAWHRGACDAQLRPRAVATAARRPLPCRRHRSGRRLDQGRLAPARRRERRRRAAVSITEAGAARVEALCGDLSRIRAPRGSELNARQWSTEAPLRMLLNNLDPEVAEKPEELVVYGGSGRA